MSSPRMWMKCASVLSVLLCLGSAVHAQGSVAPYGAGTAGIGGFVPRVWVAGSPHLGNTQFAMTVDRGRAGAAALAAFALGAANTPLL